jgi:hypothetical protein
MAKATGRILKNEDVVMQGQCFLGASGDSASRNNIRKTPTGRSQIKIVESRDDYVVLSVTCPCGTETLIKCEYAQSETLN